MTTHTPGPCAGLLAALERLVVRLPRGFCDVANPQERKMRERAVEVATAAIAAATPAAVRLADAAPDLMAAAEELQERLDVALAAYGVEAREVAWETVHDVMGDAIAKAKGEE